MSDVYDSDADAAVLSDAVALSDASQRSGAWGGPDSGDEDEDALPLVDSDEDEEGVIGTQLPPPHESQESVDFEYNREILTGSPEAAVELGVHPRTAHGTTNNTVDRPNEGRSGANNGANAPPTAPRKRGRPPGSKNKPKARMAVAMAMLAAGASDRKSVV